jgi:hypothetical protein
MFVFPLSGNLEFPLLKRNTEEYRKTDSRLERSFGVTARRRALRRAAVSAGIKEQHPGRF